MAIPYFYHNGVFEPAEPVEPLPILVLNSYCAPKANPNAELQYYADFGSSDSSEEGNSTLENDDRDVSSGHGKWIAGGAPMLSRKKTPKPFSKGEVIDLTTEDDEDEAEAEYNVYRRTYTLDDEAVHLIHRLPSPKSREAMIRHDIMSEVNPNLVKKIIKEERWDRLSIPPGQDPYVPVVSPFTPVDRPKYPLTAMHPRRSLVGINSNTNGYHPSGYHYAMAGGDPWSEKAVAQMYAAANEILDLPGQLGKRRREEPVVEEQDLSAQSFQMNGHTDIEAPPSKKPMLESYRDPNTVGLKGKAKMAISNLVHGYVSKPAGLFIKPRSSIPKTPIKASASTSGKIKHGRTGGAETSQQPPPNPPPFLPESLKMATPVLPKTPSPQKSHYSQLSPLNPRQTSLDSSKMAAPILPHTPSTQTAQYPQNLRPYAPPNLSELANIPAPVLSHTPPPQTGRQSQHLPPYPPPHSPETHKVAAPILPKTPSPHRANHSPYPRVTGRVHKPSKNLRKSKFLDTVKSKATDSEASKRISASLKRQLQDSAAGSCIQSSTVEPGSSLEDNGVIKAKKVRTKTKGSGITETVRRSKRIQKKDPAGLHV